MQMPAQEHPKTVFTSYWCMSLCCQIDATGVAYISGLGSSVIGVLRDSHHKNIAGTCTSARSWRTLIIRVKTLNLALGNNPRRRNQLLRR